MADSWDAAAEMSRSINGQGFYANNTRLIDPSRTLQDSDSLDGKVIVLAIGKGEH